MDEFETKEDFQKFLADLGQAQNSFPKQKVNQAFEVSLRDFTAMEWLELSFEEYEGNNIFIKHSTKTNEIFLGGFNDKGKVPTSVLVKVEHDTLINNQKEVLKWYENRSEKMWKK